MNNEKIESTEKHQRKCQSTVCDNNWRQEVGIDSFQTTSPKFRFSFVLHTEQTTVKIHRSSN